MSDKEPEFWAVGDPDRLQRTDIHDAVIDFLDQCDPHEWPDKIIVKGYARMQISKPDITSEVENIYEQLDEEFGDPLGDYRCDPTDEVLALADQLARQIRDDYETFACKRVKTIEVPLTDHVPEAWLDEPDVAERMNHD